MILLKNGFILQVFNKILSFSLFKRENQLNLYDYLNLKQNTCIMAVKYYIISL